MKLKSNVLYLMIFLFFSENVFSNMEIAVLAEDIWICIVSSLPKTVFYFKHFINEYVVQFFFIS